MASNSITFKLKGSSDDPDFVDAAAFAFMLHQAVVVLRSIAKDLGGERSVRLLVTDLKAASAQATIEIRRSKKTHRRTSPEDVQQLFEGGSKALATGTPMPPRLSRDTVEKLGDFTKVLRPGVSATVGLNGSTLPITMDWKARAVVGAEVGRAVEGDLRGNLEGVDLHGEQRFFLYPVLADRRVECHFSSDYLESVKTALGKYVTVTGVQKYAPDATWPDRIDVDTITVHPPAAELPSMRILLGLFDSMTRGITVEQHIAGISGAGA